jgi:nitrogen regulatory protein PII
VKKIEAIIKSNKFDEVKEALVQAGTTDFIVTEVLSFGQHHKDAMMLRGTSYHAELVPRLKIEILVRDVNASHIINALESSARTGHQGDGKIIITQVEELIQIRTGERGENAL